MTSSKPNHAEEQAKAQLASVREMVAALECDYDRLEELREELKALREEVNDARSAHLAWGSTPAESDDTVSDEIAERLREANKALSGWQVQYADDLGELEAAAGDCKDAEEARERIQEDALSIEVRSGWTTLGEPLTADEYCILLCTGGPACRIVGGLSSGEITSARLEYQDWGTPWTELITTGSDHAALITYAGCFYFGE